LAALRLCALFPAVQKPRQSWRFQKDSPAEGNDDYPSREAERKAALPPKTDFG
jgi:hypothetical protein